LVVAVKILKGHDVQTASQAAWEAMVLAKLRHRNILRVFQFQPSGTYWVVIMECVQGQNLAESRLTSGLMRQCLAQLAGAVVTMAHARIVHRDIKPANIVLRFEDSSPVLIDFGLAVDLTNPLWKPEQGITGTPLFMAPEALDGGLPHPSWDAYSLGMTAVVMLSESCYPSGLGVSDLINAKLSGQFDYWIEHSLRGVEDACMAHWCKALTSRDPESRMVALDAVCA
jgi:serine/threonine-protein kinase